MRIFWTPEALDDRRAIYDFIEADNPLAAVKLDEMFSEKVRNLLNHPDLGRVGRVAGTRELVVHKNYVIIYDKTVNSVRILRLLHSALQWPQAKQ